MGIVEEEADESLFWLELIKELELCNDTLVPGLLAEGNEILSIVVSSINTARKNK
jgi:hypothetical protein